MRSAHTTHGYHHASIGSALCKAVTGTKERDDNAGDNIDAVRQVEIYSYTCLWCRVLSRTLTCNHTVVYSGRVTAHIDRTGAFSTFMYHLMVKAVQLSTSRLATVADFALFVHVVIPHSCCAACGLRASRKPATRPWIWRHLELITVMMSQLQ